VAIAPPIPFLHHAGSSAVRSAQKDKKTLFVLAPGAQDAEGNEVANAAQVWSIQMIAQGYKKRAK
jgi:hypothetical protein